MSNLTVYILNTNCIILTVFLRFINWNKNFMCENLNDGTRIIYKKYVLIIYRLSF